MAQLTIYLDEKTLKKVERIAGQQKVSLSKWMKQRVEEYFESAWPEDFRAVLGSLDEDDLGRPESLSAPNNCSR